MDLIIDPNNVDEAAFNIQELTWEQVRKDIKKANPKLFEIIEQLDPSKKLTLVKARYPYGENIVDRAVLQLPHKSGKSVPIHEAAINDSLKKKLLYSPIPLSLPINKACEVFVKTGERAIPLKMISPNWFFGLFEITALLCGVALNPIWSVSSGAHSVLMLPKIADKIGYGRIKKELNLPLNPPRTLMDHFELFKLISNHPSYINDWYCDILFFTDEWFTKHSTDLKWANFYNYLFKETTIQTRYNRDDTAFNLTWQNLAYAISSRNLRPRPYILDTLKHLIAIGAGMQPAFCPTDSNELALPSKLLQDVYTGHYGLKNYLPTIFHLYMLMAGQEARPVYYSLSHPVLREGTPYTKTSPDVISDERELKLLFDTLISAVANGKVDLPKAYNLLHGRQYEFYHNGTDIFNEIKPAKDMPLSDPTLIKDKKRFPDREFATSAPFLSGCVRISIYQDGKK